MNKQTIITLLALVFVLCCACGLAACADNSPTHIHNYQWVDNGDGTHKQHCGVIGCDAPDINLGTHDYDTNGVCACGNNQNGERHKHEMTFTPQKDADCTTDGNVAYWYCTSCEKYFSDQNGNNELLNIVIPAKGHAWDSGTVTVPSDCLQDGVRTFECTNCHDKKTETIKAAHTWGDWEFFNDDLHIRTCQKCRQQDEPQEHFWDHNSCQSCNTTINEYSAGMKYAAVTKNDEIIGYCITAIGTASDTDLVIPEKHNELPVIRISASAFINCDNLTSVFVPDNIETIGYAAFSGCSKLYCMTMPFVGGTADIGGEVGVLGYVFGRDEFAGGEPTTQGCYYERASIRKTTYYIPKSLRKIVITQNNISYGAFYACKNLTEITLQDGIKRIGDKAFYQCENLTNLNIPNTIIYVGTDILDGCNNLRYTEYNNGVYFGNNNNPYYILKDITNNKVTSFTVHNDTKCIIASLESLGSATNISIPNGITCVQSPGNISSLYKNGAAKIWNGGEYLGNSSNPYLVLYTRRFLNLSITIHANTKVIASKALYSSEGDVIIPDNVQYIGDNIFPDSFSSTQNLTIGSGVIDMDEALGKYTSIISTISVSPQNANYTAKDGVLFNKDCTKLIAYPEGKTDVNYQIPSTVKTIAPYAFSMNRSLKNITIPDSVTKIGHNAFLYNSIESIDIPDSVLNISSAAFSESSLTDITIPSDIANIGIDTFVSCEKLTNITLPNSIKSIGDWAFAACSALESISIPNGVTSIGGDAFSYCTMLTNITIPNSVTKIGSNTFQACSNLLKVNYLGTIGDWCKIDFENRVANPLICAKNLYLNDNLVTELVIPDTVTEIKDYAFYNCKSITSVTIPNSVTSIGQNAFYECNNLLKVNYSGTIGDWCKIDFKNKLANPLYYAKNLYINDNLVTELVIPDTVTEIKDYAFYNCESITSVTIPDTVTAVGNYAFYDCASLTSITIPNSVTSIGENAFSNCDHLVEIIFDGTMSQWNDVSKGEGWNNGVPATKIICLNGEISL